VAIQYLCLLTAISGYAKSSPRREQIRGIDPFNQRFLFARLLRKLMMTAVVWEQLRDVSTYENHHFQKQVDLKHFRKPGLDSAK
jgi:hypothetical protein